MKQAADEDGVEMVRYRLELDGELDEEWTAWFEAEQLQTQDGRTIIDVRVPDQAALHGLLRRVHDLHLRLHSLTRTG